MTNTFISPEQQVLLRTSTVHGKTHPLERANYISYQENQISLLYKQLGSWSMYSSCLSEFIADAPKTCSYVQWKKIVHVFV